MAQAPTASAPAAAAQTPSPSLLQNFRHELSRHPPFAQMEAVAVDFFLTQVSGVRGMADLSGGAFEYEAGDLFPAQRRDCAPRGHYDIQSRGGYLRAGTAGRRHVGTRAAQSAVRRFPQPAHCANRPEPFRVIAGSRA